MARRGRRRQAATTVAPAPLGQARNTFPPLELISADEVERIHEASLRVLCEIGMNFLLPEAVQILCAAGASSDDGVRVRFEPEMVTEQVALAPSQFTLHARDPANSVVFGDDWVVFGMVGSPPNVSDLDRGRVTGNYVDFCNMLRLQQSLDAADTCTGHSVEPIDLEVRTRHLDAVSAMYTLSTKPGFCYSLGRARVSDAIEIARIARGIDHDTLLREPSIHTVVNANSPLVYDKPMLEGAIELARHGQPVVFTPFTLAGAMAPVTIAGALTLQNAEALAGITLAQLVNPGVPVVYGSFTSNVDMRSGAPAFGTPEYAKATIISGQLARRYGLPLRASNANASNAPDVQAAYESQMSLWACVVGGINYVLHGLGWIEGGLCASYEKVIIDAEMIQMIRAMMQPTVIDDASLAVDAIAEVGPANHFFGAAHTLERYDTAFYEPMLSDWRNFETWHEDGALDATQRANGIWKQLLADYEEPPMDDAIRAELTDFVERRRAEGGVEPL